MRIEQRVLPDQNGTPVVAHIDCLFNTQCIEKAAVVIGQMEDIVGFDFVGFIGAAIAPLVGNNAVIASIDQGFYLVAPAVGQLGPAMTEHQRNTPLPGLEDLKLDAIAGNHCGTGELHRACSWFFYFLAAGKYPVNKFLRY